MSNVVGSFLEVEAGKAWSVQSGEEAPCALGFVSRIYSQSMTHIVFQVPSGGISYTVSDDKAAEGGDDQSREFNQFWRLVKEVESLPTHNLSTGNLANRGGFLGGAVSMALTGDYQGAKRLVEKAEELL